MKLLSKLLTTSIIYLCSFQMAFGNVVTNLENSPEQIDHEELVMAIDSFKAVVNGDPSCEAGKFIHKDEVEEVKPEIEDDSSAKEYISQIVEDSSYDSSREDLQSVDDSEYFSFMKEMKKNACSAEKVDYDQKIMDQHREERCRTSQGLVARLAKAISKNSLDDEEAKIDLEKEHYTRMISRITKKAQALKEQTSQFLSGDASEEEKRDVVYKYISAVPVGMRDLMMVLRPESKWTSKLAGDYFVKLPSGLFEEWMEEWTYLQTGINPAKDPYFLEVENKNDHLSLKFDEHQMISRDLQTFMKYPEARNYVYALRMLTIQMMASQVKNYDVLREDFHSPVEMPKSCVEGKDNGVWPRELKLKIKDELQEGYLDRVLINHGLVFDYSSQNIMSYFVEDAEVNPLSDALYGSVEFDSFKNANKALSGERAPTWIKPALDDIDSFEAFIEMKKPYAKNIYRKEFRSVDFEAKQVSQYSVPMKSEMGTFKDVKLFDEIVERVPHGRVLKVGNETLNAFVMNLSPYLANKMIENKATSVKDIISADIKKLLKRNVLNLDMPSLYAPHTMRNWGLRKIHSLIKQVKDNKEIKASKHTNSFVKAVQDACFYTKSSFCQDNKGSNYFAELDNYLSSLELNGAYMPIKKLQEREIENVYGILWYLWREFRDKQNMLAEAKVQEYEYLLNQLAAGNDMARIRLGYLVAKSELENIKKIQGESCAEDAFENQIERLEDAAKEIYAHKPLRPMFFSTFLSQDEQKELWGKIKDKVNQNTSQLFTAEIDGEKTYDYIEKLSVKTVLSQEQLDDAVDNILDGEISDSTKESINEVAQNLNLEKIEFFKELISLKNHEDRRELYEQNKGKFELFSEKDLKESIIETDMALKKHVYKDLMKRAASVRKEETLKAMDKLCSSDIYDLPSLQEQFYSTMKVQDKLNQMLGLQAAPEELMDRISSMQTQEKWNMVLAMGGFFLAMGGVMAGGACAALTGGLCAPLAIAAGVAMQGYVTASEIEMKLDGDRQALRINKMNELGYTGSDAAENVTRSWAWAIIEGVSIVPFMGIALRGASMSTKMFKEMTTSLVLNTKRVGFRKAYKIGVDAGKVIGQEADVEFAKLVLGFKGWGDKLKSLTQGKNLDDATNALSRANLPADKAAQISKRIDEMKKLQESGKMSPAEIKIATKKLLKEVKEEFAKNTDSVYKYTSNVISDYSYKNIDKQTAKVVTKYFGNSPDQMRGFLGSYIKKHLPKKRGFGFSNKKTSKAAKAKLGYKKAQRGDYLWGTNWMRQAWYENTMNMAQKRKDFLRIHDELSKLPKAEMEEYVLKNIEVLTDVLAKAPMRKRDIPYLLIQGGPHIGGILNGKRLPGIQEIGEAIVVRKIFVARARLMQEAAKSQAREVIGAAKVVSADTLGNIFKNFYSTASDEAARLGGDEGLAMLKELDQVKDVVTNIMFDTLNKNPKFYKFLKKQGVFTKRALDKDKVFNLMFNPRNAVEEQASTLFWGFVKPQQIFGKPEFQFLSHKIMKEMIEDTSIQGIQKYMAAMRVLMIKDGMAVVELF